MRAMRRKIPQISCDQQVDAPYIPFNDASTELTTVRLSEDVAIDLGPKEEIVGIEVLDASEHLSLERMKPTVILENLTPA